MDIIKKNIEEMNARLPPSSDGTIQANLRILLVSTHIRQVTGYSKVAYNLVKQIAGIPKVRLMHYKYLQMRASQRAPAHYNNLYII